MENKILTWDSYIKRGGIGPSVRCLCLLGVEMVDHLMGNCHYTQDVWRDVKNYFNIEQSWSSDTIISCFIQWMVRENSWKVLPYIVYGRSTK